MQSYTDLAAVTTLSYVLLSIPAEYLFTSHQHGLISMLIPKFEQGVVQSSILNQFEVNRQILC
jgi:hypothetical protein